MNEQDKADYEAGVKVLNENNKSFSRDEVITPMFMPLDDKENN